MIPRELSTVLAALRRWQIHIEGRLPNTSELDDLRVIASDAGKPLSVVEIDALCERMNGDDAETTMVPERTELIGISSKARVAAVLIMAGKPNGTRKLMKLRRPCTEVEVAELVQLAINESKEASQ